MNEIVFNWILMCMFLTATAEKQNADIRLLQKINFDTTTSHYWKQAIVPTGFRLLLSLGQIGYCFIASDPYSKRFGVEMLISAGIGQCYQEALKIVKRPRPSRTWLNDIHPVNYSSGTSFPSGHIILAFTTTTALNLTRRQWYITVRVYTWAGSVGYSRMYLSRHYPTDVWGGIVIGICSGLLGHWVTGKIYND